MVREGQADMGFFYSTGRKHHDLQVVRLYLEPAFLVASRQNPLANAKGLHYEDLGGMEFVYPHDTCCFVTMLIPELVRRKITLKRVSYLGGMQLVVDQARREGAVTLAPQCALRRFEETYGLVRLDMQEKPLSAWETILLGKHAKKEAVQELLNFSMREAQHIVREYGLEAEEGEENRQ
jgi:DNA-binding transcriptional LysR family regulator